MKYIMGIDQGTTGTRAMIFDADVNIIAQAYSEFTQYFPKDGWVEHDAEEIWETTQAMMKKALAEAGIIVYFFTSLTYGLIGTSVLSPISTKLCE